MTFLAENYISLTEKHLACSWTLVENERLIMGHELTMWPELTIMNWALLGIPKHTAGPVIYYKTEVLQKWDQKRAEPKGRLLCHPSMLYLGYLFIPITHTYGCKCPIWPADRKIFRINLCIGCCSTQGWPWNIVMRGTPPNGLSFGNNVPHYPLGMENDVT